MAVLASLSVSGIAWANNDSTALTTTNTVAGTDATKKAAYGSMQDKLRQKESGRVDIQQKKEEMLTQRCAKIQERIQNRMGNMEAGKENHMEVYQNMATRVSKFIERLSGEGYDTAKVKADLEILKTKIQKFSTDRAAQMTTLGETKNYACGKTDGEFKGKLAEARTSLQLVHADAMDIRKYMLTTVRPDIQALRTQKVEAKKTTDATKTSAPELE